MSPARRPAGRNQQELPLGHRAASGRADFIVAPCNAAAVRVIDEWPRWAFGRAAAIVGPSGAGKSHLAQVLAARAGVRVVSTAMLEASVDESLVTVAPLSIVEDVDDGIDERSLLHLYNATIEAGGCVMLTARRPPARWGLRLPDLASRLRAIHVAIIEQPDDELLAALLVKLFTDRQIAIGADAVDYLARRVERSYSALQSVIEALDRVALREGRPITVPLIRSVLAGPDSPYDETMNS